MVLILAFSFRLGYDIPHAGLSFNASDTLHNAKGSTLMSQQITLVAGAVRGLIVVGFLAIALLPVVLAVTASTNA